MVIIPAIDIKDGRVVRLQQGDPARATRYGDDPVAWARRFRDLGARWLHVVDLDGAFSGRPVHLELVREIAALGVPVQVGGGIRTVADVRACLEAGAARVILGTAALRLAAQTRVFGERIVASLDVRSGRLAVEGWGRQTEIPAVEAARRLANEGIHRLIYTDVARDGMMTGPDVEALAAFVRAAGVPVIAAGGAADPTDLEALASTGVEGVVVGRAIYEGRIDPAEALGRWSGARC